RFATLVVAHRSCLAVRDPRVSLTYGELDGWANAIADLVLNRTGDGLACVPLVFAQGAASTAAILGTLKSGKAYVSLDPVDPRGTQIVESVNAVLVLTDEEHRDAACALAGGRPVVVIDAIGSADAPSIETTPADLAYVFFTSGSTGRPKGVFDTHRNVLHNVLRYTNALHIAPTDRLSLVQSPSFSGTVSSLFSALLNGAAVFPFRLDLGGVGRLADWMCDERITIYHSVPAIFRALLHSDVRSFPDVRVVRLEGDRAASLDVDLHRRHFGGGSVLVNGLGLTETGLVRQLFVDREMAIEQGILPVGYPVRDMKVLIVDDNADEVPPGASGEIAVRSPYLALGYWNEPELTGERFLKVGEARTYLTGDLGRIRDDGCLEYLGRRDGGFKILGNRVEPAEVEAELVRLSGVKEAAVATREGRRGEGRLFAFVVMDEGHVLCASDARAALAERLPSYMVPSTVSAIDELPLGTSGKVDRGALPVVPDRTGARLPADDLERLVARVWEDILEVGSIAADDNFFTLGGDSLAAAEIVACLEQETGTSLSVSVLAGSPTVADLADALRTGPRSAQSSLVVFRPDGDRTPLVLVHGNTGNLLHYAGLLPLLDRDRPVWGLEYMTTHDLSVERIAASHVRSLVREDPSGPFAIVGFCYGAVVAHEIACQLRAEGHEVSLLALLGITPLEFPTLLPSCARDRWRREQSFLSRTRYHLENAWTMPTRERPRYLATRGINLLTRTWRRIGRREPQSMSVHDNLLHALAMHRPTAYPGQALVVLHAEETAVYTENPARDWAALADHVDIEVLPGAEHAMLEEPGSGRLAELIHDRLSSID
ncbi:MAG: AMP-binding protein, partial [Thermoleophilia bacterium]|nr:AMP-binding protein [Thermoleophilia bacterium]